MEVFFGGLAVTVVVIGAVELIRYVWGDLQ